MSSSVPHSGTHSWQRRPARHHCDVTETHTITVTPLGVEVPCRADQPILEACLRHGINLPHSCTHGTCGTCKVEIVDGTVELGEASTFALLDSERNQGKALICTAKPTSDVIIEADVEDEDGVIFHPVRDFVGTVTSIEDCARDIRRVQLELDHDIAFNPGQYVQVHIPGTTLTRSWSIASPPSQPGRIELNIRCVPGGAATAGWVFAGLTTGHQVALTGPYGRFFLRPTRDEPALLIGGGTGLAPLKAIVRHVLESGAAQSLYLYHGARTRADLYDVDYFEELQRQSGGRLSYRPVLSEQTPEGFRHGNVTDAVADEFATCAGHVAYLCGPPAMVEAALKMLMKKRLFPRDIYREDFFDARDKVAGVRSPLLRTS